jgi:hypothetical protein
MGTTDREWEPITDAKLAELRDLHGRATRPGTWHWSGNLDTGEPYLACWVPGAGRCNILAIGWRERSTESRDADYYRSWLRENAVTLQDDGTYRSYDDDEIEDAVREWTTDSVGESIREPELWLYDDMMALPARDRAIFEVAPEATSRDDPKVYRADIVGLRHPDPQLIVDAINQLGPLLARLDKAEARVKHLEGEVRYLTGATDE